MRPKENTDMNECDFQTIDDLVSMIISSGCRVTIPYMEPSPLTVIFDGSFSGAEFIPSYPATLYIFGINGNIAVNCINSIDKVCDNKYVLNFGDESHAMDMMIKILD